MVVIVQDEVAMATKEPQRVTSKYRRAHEQEKALQEAKPSSGFGDVVRPRQQQNQSRSKQPKTNNASMVPGHANTEVVQPLGKETKDSESMRYRINSLTER